MMQYALFTRPVVTIYDLPQTTKQSEAGLVSTIGDEGLYGQACQVRTAPGGVTAEGVPLSPEVAEVVTFYGYHGFVRRDALKFVSEDALRAYLPQPLVLVGRATDVLSLPKVQGVRMLELERGCLLCRLPEPPEEAEAHAGWAKVALLDGRTGYDRDVALEPVRFEMTAVFSQREGLAFDDALAEAQNITAGELCRTFLCRFFQTDHFQVVICDLLFFFSAEFFRLQSKLYIFLHGSPWKESVVLKNGNIFHGRFFYGLTVDFDLSG